MPSRAHYTGGMANQSKTAELCVALNLIVRALVSDADAVTVGVTDRIATVIQIRAAKGKDTGKLIGKHGRTVHALRVILQAIAKEHGEKYLLDIAGTKEQDDS